MRCSANRNCLPSKRLWLSLGLMCGLALTSTVQAADPDPAVPPTTKTADAPVAAPSRSQVQEQSLERLLPATQQRRLDIGEQAFLGLFLPAARPKPLGGVILIAGQHEHADWPLLVGPARRQLSTAGWHTLAISLPEQGNLERELDDAQRLTQDQHYRDQALARIQAAQQVLKAEGGTDKDLAIVLLGRGAGALWALNAAVEGGGTPAVALVLQDLPQTTQGEMDTARLLEQWKGPTYDILMSPSAHAETRKLQAKRLGNEHYRQLLWPQSGNAELKQQMLIKRVGGWLQRTLSENPDNA